jgi:hypothetical protein
MAIPSVEPQRLFGQLSDRSGASAKLLRVGNTDRDAIL